jgi:hypothetical protein
MSEALEEKFALTTSRGFTSWLARSGGSLALLYDVAFLSGVRTPAAIGFKTDEILRVISIDE